MSSDDNRRAELLRRFEEVISGAELDDLREMVGDLSRLDVAVRREACEPRRADLRRRPLGEVAIFRVRIDLKGSRPRIWRRLELRSDLTLDVVHRVLQVAFAWTDTHLWRFSLGGEPFSPRGQSFLCPWDVAEGEFEDEGELAASAVRLDETMQEPGDVLHYVYDYGDSWELTLRLEEVAPAPGPAPGYRPAAVVVGGRRAAPPEDCGGLTDGSDLAEVLEDPERFDIDEANAVLQGPYVALADHNLDARLVNLLDRLTLSPLGEEIERRALALLADPGRPADHELGEALRAFTWFLDRAAEGPIPLTAAGYLRPADVQAAAEQLPGMSGWIGKANREAETIPVLHFRQMLQSLGLLRKHRGTLRLTRAGGIAQRAPEELWNRLADKLVPPASGFDADATLLLLAWAATSPGAEVDLEAVASALTLLGWQTGTGRPVASHDLLWLPAFEVLRNATAEPIDQADRRRISPVAARLARAALHRR